MSGGCSRSQPWAGRVASGAAAPLKLSAPAPGCPISAPLAPIRVRSLLVHYPCPPRCARALSPTLNSWARPLPSSPPALLCRRDTAIGAPTGRPEHSSHDFAPHMAAAHLRAPASAPNTGLTVCAGALRGRGSREGGACSAQQNGLCSGCDGMWKLCSEDTSSRESWLTGNPDGAIQMPPAAAAVAPASLVCRP